jgi:hypothetical protein
MSVTLTMGILKQACDMAEALALNSEAPHERQLTSFSLTGKVKLSGSFRPFSLYDTKNVEVHI